MKTSSQAAQGLLGDRVRHCLKAGLMTGHRLRLLALRTLMSTTLDILYFY